MGDTRVAEQVPVVAFDRTLVADRERRQHAGSARISDAAHLMRARAVARQWPGRVHQFGRRIAHITGRAHALLSRLSS
jgi:hypothetical protein